MTHGIGILTNPVCVIEALFYHRFKCNLEITVYTSSSTLFAQISFSIEVIMPLSVSSVSFVFSMANRAEYRR